MAYKIECIDFYYVTDMSKKSVAILKDVPRSCLQDWIKKEPKIRQTESLVSRRRCNWLASTAKFPELEKKLVEYLKDRNSKKRVTLPKALIKQSRKYAEEMHLYQFVGSYQFLANFCNRNGYSLRRVTHCAQDMRPPSVIANAVIDFYAYLDQFINAFGLDFIINMDETPIWFDMPQNYTMAEVGVHSVETVHSGYDKQRISVALTITANGETLDTMVIFKGLVKAPKNITQRPSLLVEGRPCGSMDSDLIIEYAKKVIFPYTKGRPALLIMDRCKAHMTAPVLEIFRENGIKCVYLPPRSTYYLQPLDVSINKPFKGHIREKYDIWNEADDHTTTKGGNRKRAAYEEVLQWVDYAHNNLINNKEMIKKSFFKTKRNKEDFCDSLKKIISHATKTQSSNQASNLSVHDEPQCLSDDEEEFIAPIISSTDNQVAISEENSFLNQNFFFIDALSHCIFFAF
jgi:hypothetical protein